jgi:histidinol dehydrogenase
VDKIGPGNLFVALAKKCVYGEVDIDSIARRSSGDCRRIDRPEFTAMDLIASEHARGQRADWLERGGLDRRRGRLSRQLGN